MAGHTIPHFQNDAGHPTIRIGVKEFKCIGALPPQDHPHIYLDMGKDTEIVCSYCSTLYVFNGELLAGISEPLSAIYHSEVA